MSSRITRENLNTVLKTLNGIASRLDLPHRYDLIIWSPGDGWTRYQLEDSDGREISRVCTRGEIYDVLYSLVRVLEVL